LATDRVANDFVAITARAASLLIGEPQQLVIELNADRVSLMPLSVCLTPSWLNHGGRHSVLAEELQIRDGG
jgi:hypothetical protein